MVSDFFLFKPISSLTGTNKVLKQDLSAVIIPEARSIETDLAVLGLVSDFQYQYHHHKKKHREEQEMINNPWYD